MRAILHIGAGKTGTSALQAGLVRGRDALRAAGVHYPPAMDDSDRRAARGEITSGNAVALGRFLNPKAKPQPDRAAVREWLARAVVEAQGRDLLFSSELMQFAGAAEAEELVGLLAAAGYAPRVICYVRHLLDHAVAVYGQHAKQGLEALRGYHPPVRSLPDWLRRYRLPFGQYLAPWEALLGRAAIEVRLYDAERQALLPRFLERFGVAAASGGAGTDTVNRSPTPAELVVFEALAQRPDGAALCKALTRLTMNRPAPRSAPIVAEADFAAFAAANEPLRAAFDAAWFGGGGALRLRSDAIALGPVVPPPAAEVHAVFGDALAAVVEADAARRAEHAARMARRDAGR